MRCGLQKHQAKYPLILLRGKDYSVLRNGKEIMKHRHLTDDAYTLAAIDDVIDRGGRADWAALRDAACVDQGVLKKILRVCEVRKEDG